MIRNLKALGLMAVAACAMSAMFASAAQATPNGIFTAGLTPSTHTPTHIHAEQYGDTDENVFETAKSSVHCLVATFTASDSDGTATEMTVTPKYEHCVALNLPATVTMNGCSYNFDRPTHLSNHTTWTGTVDLNCPVGKVVEVHAYLGGTPTAHNTPICTITVSPAKNLGHVEYHNQPASQGTKDDLTITANVKNVPVEEHGAACPDGNTVKTTGTYTSKITAKATDAEGKQDDLWISTGL